MGAWVCGHLKALADFPFLSGQHFYWLYVVTALGLAAGLYLRQPAGGRSLAGFWRYCFPRAVYTHRSARLDYGFVPLYFMAMLTVVLPLAALTFPWAARGSQWLAGQLLPPALRFSPHALAFKAAYTLLSVLAMDFGVWLAHYLMHRVPLLWEFHKVHHAAEVLTPITSYRKHPVEDLFAISVSGAMSGIVYGLFRSLAATPVSPLMAAGLNVVLFAFYILGFNLRHSHVWLSYGRILHHVLVSPALHQIHHSNDSRHFNRNFGLIFAIWDWMFGTLYIPRGKEPITFGLGPGGQAYSGVLRLYWLPFLRCLQRLGWRQLAHRSATRTRPAG